MLRSRAIGHLEPKRMADDNIDFRFLGRQVQNLQGDVRDLRAGHLRLEGDVVGLRADLSRMQAVVEARLDGVEARIDRLEARFDRFESSNDTRFEQMSQTAATNLHIVLEAIKNK